MVILWILNDADAYYKKFENRNVVWCFISGYYWNSYINIFPLNLKHTVLLP